MNRFLAMAAVVLATAGWVGADLAEAKRMGGGRSIGAQRQATPTAPNTPSAAPTAPAASAQTAVPGRAAAPAASGASRWLGPLAGEDGVYDYKTWTREGALAFASSDIAPEQAGWFEAAIISGEAAAEEIAGQLGFG